MLAGRDGGGGRVAVGGGQKAIIGVSGARKLGNVGVGRDVEVRVEYGSGRLSMRPVWRAVRCELGPLISNLIPNSFPKCLARKWPSPKWFHVPKIQRIPPFFRSGLSELKHSLGRWGQLLEKNPQGTLCPFVR